MRWNGFIDFSTSCAGPQTNSEGNLRNLVIHKGATFPTGVSIPQAGQLFFYMGTSYLSLPSPTLYQYNGTSWTTITGGGGGGAGGGYIAPFHNVDLAAGILTVPHNLGSLVNIVAIYDDSNQLVIPSDITLSDANTLCVDLGDNCPISGTWYVIVTAGSGPQGVSGYSGYSGYSGVSGYSGENPGASGYSGISGYSGGGGGTGLNFTKTITQPGHGLIVGNVVKFDGTDYVKAQADTVDNAEVIGIVSSVAGDDFALLYSGYITGLTGLTAGDVYFLSDTVSGGLTTVEPASSGSISKPLLIATSSTTGYLFNFRGIVGSGGGYSPVGSVTQFAGSAAPVGWLLCDGSAISQITYAALYTVIGTTYGAPGGGNFNLPDLRERVPVGYKSGSAEFGTLGGTGGEKTHTLIEAEMPAHTHTAEIYGNPGVSPAHFIQQINNLVNDFGVGAITNSTGGSSSHNNLQPYQVINYIIKY